MSYHSVMQWLFYFYLYCFLGWIFESTVVSISQRRLVNRGFMKGPFLPIYGFGALSILLSTLPVRARPFLVFLVGLLAATILEYITGVLMERLFKVRYWDYSHKRFNLNGHICLSSSLAWGGFSLLLTAFIHPRLEQFAAILPPLVPDVTVYVVSAWFLYDFTTSFHSAFSLRELLEKDEALKGEIEALRARLSEMEARYAQARSSVNEHIDALRDTTEDAFNARLARLEALPEEMRRELTQRSARMHQAMAELRSRISEKPDLRRLLRRNPGATSLRYARSFSDIRQALENAVKKNHPPHKGA